MKKDRYLVVFGDSSISDLTEREKDLVTEVLHMAGIDYDVYLFGYKDRNRKIR